jgi:drug/metabolite transporter (DMT)-like permease
VAGLMSLPFGDLQTRHTAFGLAMLLAVGVFATAAQLLMTRAFATGRPLVNASLQYLGIAYAFVFGVMLFDDPVTPMAVVGMALVIGAGVAATRLRSRAAPAHALASTLKP